VQSSKSTGGQVCIATELPTGLKAYAQRMNISMSEVMTEYIESLRHTDSDVHTPDAHPSEPLTGELNRLQERVEEKSDQIQHLRSELTEKNRQAEVIA
jgi:uncharacterized protein YoxC